MRSVVGGAETMFDLHQAAAHAGVPAETDDEGERHIGLATGELTLRLKDTTALCRLALVGPRRRLLRGGWHEWNAEHVGSVLGLLRLLGEQRARSQWTSANLITKVLVNGGRHRRAPVARRLSRSLS